MSLSLFSFWCNWRVTEDFREGSIVRDQGLNDESVAIQRPCKNPSCVLAVYPGRAAAPLPPQPPVMSQGVCKDYAGDLHYGLSRVQIGSVVHCSYHRPGQNC